MSFHVFLFFLMVSLLWLCRLYLLHRGLAHSRAGAVHPWSTVCSSPTPHSIVRPVAIPPPSQRVRVHRLCLCGPGAR